MPQFFIDRPVFAWVLAILITLGGLIAITRLPSESYPLIAPPQVVVSATYPGADAATVEATVTQVIEQQLTGIDNLIYFTSTSGSDGTAQITLTFESGADADAAAVQTQNRVSLAQPRLPTEVVQQGIRVAKSSTGFLAALSLTSAPGGLDVSELNNFVASHVLDTMQRIPGVSSASQFGAEYGMRIWLNPDKLRGYNMSAASVLDTVRKQNVQFAAGSIGTQPAIPGQQVSATVVTEGRFSSPEQFENILLRTDPNGTSVRLKDVARVRLGQSQYGTEAYVDETPVATFAILLLPNANALEVMKAVRERMAALAPSFPPGVTWSVSFDSTTFIQTAIHEVLITLVEAVVLVFVVMLVFLQSFRATLIPTLVVPVALLGALIGMYVVGFSINQLTLFAMVLAIGIVVDDAIVVVEAVERIMREDKLPPNLATRKAMQQITGAIVAITLVLAAVFIPSALQSGSVGVIYRQFALTIAVSMGFSAFLALTFTPALCATLLRPEHLQGNFIFNAFNRAYERTQNGYVRRVYQSVAHTPRWMIGFAVIVVLSGFLFLKLSGSFVPEEDQGYALIEVQLPAGATLERSRQTMMQIDRIMHRSPAVQNLTMVAGSSFTGNGENVGRAFVKLKPYSERSILAPEFIRWANKALSQEIHDAQVYVINVPTIRGLGAFGGFDFYLEDRGGQGRAALADAQNAVLNKAAADPAMTSVRINSLKPAPRLQLGVDRVQAEALGLSASDVFTNIQLMLAPVYANDFLYQGRVLRVLLQADAPYRMTPDALSHFYLPNASNAMIPLSNFVKPTWGIADPVLTRYNGYPAVEITGANAPNKSSGEAMERMEQTVTQNTPRGFGYDWAGLSLQELRSGSQAPMLFALSILVVYLCLAALYESWTVPIAVLMAVPVGLLGSSVAALVRGLPNDVFFKVGLLTIIGLTAKNAILIVEFAVTERSMGKSLHEAVMEAARLRFRPILMTSFAFILGVFPMAVSTGAGANARHAIGTGVVGGMLSAAVLGVLLIPVCFVAIRRLMGDKLDEGGGAATLPPPT
jgi:multidrug efflux pump